MSGFYVNGTNISTLFKTGTVSASTNGGFRINNLDVKSTLKATSGEQSAIQTYFRILNSDLNTIFRDVNFTDVDPRSFFGGTYANPATNPLSSNTNVSNYYYLLITTTTRITFLNTSIQQFEMFCVVIGGGGGGGNGIAGNNGGGGGGGAGKYSEGSFTTNGTDLVCTIGARHTTGGSAGNLCYIQIPSGTIISTGGSAGNTPPSTTAGGNGGTGGGGSPEGGTGGPSQSRGVNGTSNETSSSGGGGSGNSSNFAKASGGIFDKIMGDGTKVSENICRGGFGGNISNASIVSDNQYGSGGGGCKTAFNTVRSGSAGASGCILLFFLKSHLL